MLFQASWPLQSHTVNLASALSAQGHDVTLCLLDVDTACVGAEPTIAGDVRFATWPRERERPLAKLVERLSRSAEGAGRVGSFSLRLGRAARRRVERLSEYALLLAGSTRDIIPHEVLRDSSSLAAQFPALVVIGVEKGGLVWAAEIAKKCRAPLVYYSLELYTRDHPFFAWGPREKRLKLGEERSHRLADATIIQDRARARVLLADNRADCLDIAFLPVSVPGPPTACDRGFLHARLKLPDESLIALQLGLISKHRMNSAIAKAAQAFGSSWVLVTHGAGDPEEVEAIRRVDSGGRVALSLEPVDAMALPLVVASATAGLVLYSSSLMNDLLTAHSSEKLALFLRAGVPVVAFDYPGYDIIEAYDCGVLIRDLAQLPAALEAILLRHDEMSANAVRCFQDHYDFNDQVIPTLHLVQKLMPMADSPNAS